MGFMFKIEGAKVNVGFELCLYGLGKGLWNSQFSGKIKSFIIYKLKK